MFEVSINHFLRSRHSYLLLSAEANLCLCILYRSLLPVGHIQSQRILTFESSSLSPLGGHQWVSAQRADKTDAMAIP